MHIRGDHTTERQLHQVATYQFRRRHSFPSAISLDRGVERQAGFESGKGGLSTTLLEIGKRRVEYKKGRYYASFVVLMQDGLKHDGRFEQPWHRRPEFCQCIAQRMSGRIRHRIGAVFLKTRAGVLAGEPL